MTVRREICRFYVDLAVGPTPKPVKFDLQEIPNCWQKIFAKKNSAGCFLTHPLFLRSFDRSSELPLFFKSKCFFFAQQPRAIAGLAGPMQHWLHWSSLTAGLRENWSICPNSSWSTVRGITETVRSMLHNVSSQFNESAYWNYSMKIHPLKYGINVFGTSDSKFYIRQSPWDECRRVSHCLTIWWAFLLLHS